MIRVKIGQWLADLYDSVADGIALVGLGRLEFGDKIGGEGLRPFAEISAETEVMEVCSSLVPCPLANAGLSVEFGDAIIGLNREVCGVAGVDDERLGLPHVSDLGGDGFDWHEL